MADYPINVFTHVYREDTAKIHQEIDALGKAGNWSDLLKQLKRVQYVNCCKPPIENENQMPSLFTPLHYADWGAAPIKVFELLIKIGASKCLKTAAGETAYDIAKNKGLNADILELLKIPKDIKQNEQTINKMEKGLHSVIKGRVENLLKKNGQSLPQLAFLFEKGSFYYSVPGMYGGFSVSQRDDGIQVESLIRICGGSDEKHFIDKEGNVKLIPNDNPF